jgi:hypothetical protein
MTTRFLFFFLLLFIPLHLFGKYQPSFSDSANPIISSITPSQTYQYTGRGDGATSLRIYGLQLWPLENPQFGSQKQRLQVFFKKNEGFEPIYTLQKEFIDGEETVLVKFSSEKWLSEPGNLQVMVVVDRLASRPVTLKIIAAPTGPPRLFRAVPDSFTIVSDLESSEIPYEYYSLQLQGKDFGDPEEIQVRIAGRNPEVKNIDATRGTIGLLIPQLLWTHPQSFLAQIFNKQGASNAIRITMKEDKHEDEEEKEDEKEALKTVLDEFESTYKEAPSTAKQTEQKQSETKTKTKNTSTYDSSSFKDGSQHQKAKEVDKTPHQKAEYLDEKSAQKIKESEFWIP